jgi:hypothetical protein
MALAGNFHARVISSSGCTNAAPAIFAKAVVWALAIMW